MLYVSWVYTRSYPEYWNDVPIPFDVPSLTGTAQNPACLLIPYEVKARALAWLLGHTLQDIKFQSYAMRRHMHAVLYRCGPVGPFTFRSVRTHSECGSPLNLFLKRLFVRGKWLLVLFGGMKRM
jgi:hypothetical protein